MAIIEYVNDDEMLRGQVYPLMDQHVVPIAIVGFANKQALSRASLPSAMIKHMAEKGKLNRIAGPRPQTMHTAANFDWNKAMQFGTQVVSEVLKFIQDNPGFIDWIRNGLDFGRLDRYSQLVVYEPPNGSVELEFR